MRRLRLTPEEQRRKADRLPYKPLECQIEKQAMAAKIKYGLKADIKLQTHHMTPTQYSLCVNLVKPHGMFGWSTRWSTKLKSELTFAEQWREMQQGIKNWHARNDRDEACDPESWAVLYCDVRDWCLKHANKRPDTV